MKLKNLKTGEIVEKRTHTEAISKGYAFGIGDIPEGMVVQRANGDYAVIPPHNQNQFEILGKTED